MVCSIVQNLQLEKPKFDHTKPRYLVFAIVADYFVS